MLARNPYKLSIITSLSKVSSSLWRNTPRTLEPLRKRLESPCVLCFSCICMLSTLVLIPLLLQVKIAVYASLCANFCLCVLQRESRSINFQIVVFTHTPITLQCMLPSPLAPSLFSQPVSTRCLILALMFCYSTFIASQHVWTIGSGLWVAVGSRQLERSLMVSPSGITIGSFVANLNTPIGFL